LIFGQKISTEAGLFIHDEFNKAVGVGGDEIGVIDGTSALLDVLQVEAKDKGKDCKSGDGKCEKANQKSVILLRIHGDFPLFRYGG
jgi:hypothetical protein